MAYVPVLLGHRGIRVNSQLGENTFGAFDAALQAGADGFEFDVRLTGSGRGLVCHDDVVEGVVVSRALPHELRHLPVVQDVICRYANKAFLDIELKVDGLEHLVLDALRNCPAQREYVVSSFLPEVVMELRARSARIVLGIICETKSQLARWPNLPVEGVIVHHKLVSENLVKQVHGAKKSLSVWTVNDPAEMRRFADLDVDVIISDDPKLLVETLRPKKDPKTLDPGSGLQQPPAS